MQQPFYFFKELSWRNKFAFPDILKSKKFAKRIRILVLWTTFGIKAASTSITSIARNRAGDKGKSRYIFKLSGEITQNFACGYRNFHPHFKQ